jgi:hypothetical protein
MRHAGVDTGMSAFRRFARPAASTIDVSSWHRAADFRDAAIPAAAGGQADVLQSKVRKARGLSRRRLGWMIVGYRNSPRTPALSGTRDRDLARGRSSDMLRQRVIEGLQPLIACAIARYTGQSLFSYHNKLGLRRDSASMFEELSLNVRAEGVRSDAEHLQCNVSSLLIDDNDFVHHQFLFGPFDPKRRCRFCGHGGTLDLTSIDRNGFVRILRPPPLDWPGQDAGLAGKPSLAPGLRQREPPHPSAPAEDECQRIVKRANEGRAAARKRPRARVQGLSPGSGAWLTPPWHGPSHRRDISSSQATQAPHSKSRL